MDPFTITMIIGLAISAGGAIVSEIGSAQERAYAESLMRQAMDETGKINLPKLEQLTAEKLGTTNLSKIVTDPQLALAQYNSLNKMGEIADSGGMTMEDEAVLNKSLGRASQQNTANRNAISNQMASRGMSNSGAELAMMLDAQQDAADFSGQAAMDTAGMAQKRAFDAIMARGNMAGQMRAQEYGEKSDAARAQDEIDRYNNQMKWQEGAYNNSMAQQGFQNQMQKQGELNKARMGMAGYQQAEADRQQQVIAGTTNAAGQTVMGYGAMKYGPQGTKPPDPNNPYGYKSPLDDKDKK